MKLTIRHLRMRSGKVFTVYAIDQRRELGHNVWHVLCGSSTNVKPRWRNLLVTKTGKPYFWLDNTKLYLDSFKAA